jgi:hypothetical protein
MSGKAKTRKTFGSKLKDQQNDNKTLYSLANQGTIMSATNSVVTGGSVGGGTIAQVAANDLNMNTYDINDVDRFKFAVKEGAGDALAVTDYGIEAIYNSGDAYGMSFRVPATKSFYFNSGSGQFSFSDTLGIVTGEPILCGSLKSSFIDFDNIVSPSNPATNHVKLFADSDNSDHLTVRKSDGSEVDLESAGSGWVGTATTQLNMGSHSIKGAWGGTANTLGIQSDLDMETYDIINICRLEFDPAGSTLANSATGIDATSAELHFNVPTGDSFKFTINGVEQFWVGVDQVSFASNELIALGNIDSDIKLDGGHTIRSNDSSNINIHVSDTTNEGSYGSVGIPYVFGSSYPTETECDTWFGNVSGNIAVFRHTSSTDRLYFNTYDGWNYINADGIA